VGFEFITLVVIGIDCTGSCKSNYYMIMTTTAHSLYYTQHSIHKITAWYHLYYFTSLCDCFLLDHL